MEKTKNIEVVKNAKNEGKKTLQNKDYTDLFCKTLKNAITSNRLILASTFLSLNAGIAYKDLLTFAKTSCGVEWNDSNRAFFSQPIRAGRKLFAKYEKDESFLKIANAEELPLEAKAEKIVELLCVKKITVNNLLRVKKTKAEEVKAEEVKAEEVKAEEVKAEEVKAEEVKAEEVKAEETTTVDCTLIKPQDNMTIEEKIASDLFTLQDKYKYNSEEFILACFSAIEFLASNDFEKMKQYLDKYIDLSSQNQKVA